MRNRGGYLTASLLGLIGLIVVLVQNVRVLTGSSLDHLNTIALYVGLGLFAVGAALVVVLMTLPERVGPEQLQG